MQLQVHMPRIESLLSMTLAADNLVDNAAPAMGLAAPAQGGLSRAFSRADLVTATPTTLSGCPKLGSLQGFVTHKCDAGDMSPSHFSADNVHRIGILDIRLLNCDRHTGNLLVCEGERVSGGSASSSTLGAPYLLVPIDHGYALPEALDNPYFEWLFWSQASVPFSEEVKEYVARLDAKADAAMLREKVPSLREECLRCLEVTTKVRFASTPVQLDSVLLPSSP
jgi:hypothetical protein